jgi:hypothetical protein
MELAARWRASGLTAAEFGRQQEVGAHRVRYWARRAKVGGVAGGQPEFYVMTAGGPAGAGTGPRPQAEQVPSRRGGTAVVIVVPLPAGRRALADALGAVLSEVKS